ncbi:hypothetical protein Rin_00009390 [Candidatus Regiella insecticola 5.15]|uniref:Uncharacterized protein n=1 Tax=Candidatus Regiella insecticola 5.15 TaxID=1005043 RepID=G2GYT1_9ENTR|nr:hypothetical protein Rin_00009390 [Candidatus Regiella insecticola 5.15]
MRPIAHTERQTVSSTVGNASKQRGHADDSATDNAIAEGGTQIKHTDDIVSESLDRRLTAACRGTECDLINALINP